MTRNAIKPGEKVKGVCVTLNADDRELLTMLGRGNLSAGVRAAAELVRKSGIDVAAMAPHIAAQAEHERVMADARESVIETTRVEMIRKMPIWS